MSEIKLEHVARDFWATRPHRHADDRKIAGVAAAIGRRYAIDPVLVRVAFVVAAFAGGGGVLLYLLGWLALPAGDDQPSGAESVAKHGRISIPVALTIMLVLLLIPTTGVVLIPTAGALLGNQGGSGIIGLAVGLGALFLLHRSRASLGEIPGAPAAQPATPGEPAPATSAQSADESGAPAPPAWDPLGAAPFAWDLPEPSAPAPSTPAHSVRSKITPITLGLALLTGGLALALTPALSAAQVAAMLLGVIGLGLVVGSFLQGGRGLIPVAIPLVLLTWILGAAPTSALTVGGQHWHPLTAAQVQPQYSVTLGNGDLDLTGLQLAEGQTVTTSVAVSIGQTHVLLPRNVDAEVSCQSQLGDVHCLDQNASNGYPSRVTVTDRGPDGAGGGKLVLDVRSAAGQVHVDRAS